MEDEYVDVEIAAISERLDVLRLDVESTSFKEHVRQDIEQHGLGTPEKRPPWVRMTSRIGVFVDQFMNSVSPFHRQLPGIMFSAMILSALRRQVARADIELANADIATERASLTQALNNARQEVYDVNREKDRLIQLGETNYATVEAERDQLRLVRDGNRALIDNQVEEKTRLQVEIERLRDVCRDDQAKRMLAQEDVFRARQEIESLKATVARLEAVATALPSQPIAWSDDREVELRAEVNALEVQVNESRAAAADTKASLNLKEIELGLLQTAVLKANERAEALAKDCATLRWGKGVTAVDINNSVRLARDEIASFKNEMRLSFKNLNDQQQMPAPSYAKATESSKAKGRKPAVTSADDSAMEVDSPAVASEKAAGKKPEWPAPITEDPRAKASANPESRAAAASANAKRKAAAEGSRAPTAMGHSKKRVAIDLTNVDTPAPATVAQGDNTVSGFIQAISSMTQVDQWEAVRLATGAEKIMPGQTFEQAGQNGLFLKAALSHKALASELGRYGNADRLIKAVENLGEGIATKAPSAEKIRWQDKAIKHVARIEDAPRFLIVNFVPALGDGVEVHESIMRAWVHSGQVLTEKVNGVVAIKWEPNGAQCKIRFADYPEESVREGLNAKSPELVQTWMQKGTKITVERWVYQTALVITRCPTGEMVQGGEKNVDGTPKLVMKNFTMAELEAEIRARNKGLSEILCNNNFAPRWKWTNRKDLESTKGSASLVVYILDTKGGAHARPWWKWNRKVSIFDRLCPCEPYALPKGYPFCLECKRWGHHTSVCRIRASCCDKCGDDHVTDLHEYQCAFCESERNAMGGDKGKNQVQVVCPSEHAYCPNCGCVGHSAKSATCKFQRHRLDTAWHEKNKGAKDVPAVHVYFRNMRSRIRRAVDSAGAASQEYQWALPKKKTTDQSPSGFAPYQSPLTNATAGPSGSMFGVLEVEDGEVKDAEDGQGRILVPNSQPEDKDGDSVMEETEGAGTSAGAATGGDVDDEEFIPVA